MLGKYIFVLRYLFLILLYFFLFYVFYQMFKLLKNQESGIQFSRSIPVRPKDSPTLNRYVASKAKLVTLTDGGLALSKTYPVGNSLSLGRAPGNQILIADPRVSRYHARIYSSGGQYWVEDLNSRNGTFLNGTRVYGSVLLADGDKLRIGDVTFAFVRWGYEVEQNDARGVGAQY